MHGNKRKKTKYSHYWNSFFDATAAASKFIQKTSGTSQNYPQSYKIAVSSTVPGEITETRVRIEHYPVGYRHKMRTHFIEGLKGEFNANSSKRLVSGIGKQGITDLTFTFSPAEILTALSNLSGAAYWNIESTRFPVLNYYLKNVKLKTHISNASNHPVTVWVYDVTFRKNMANAVTNSNPIQAWLNGYTDQNSTVNTSLIPFQTPFKSRMFTKYFKVNHVTKIHLATGCDHIHNLSFSPNATINTEDLNAVAATGYLAGITHCQFIVVLGPVGDDSTSPGNNISYMPAAVNTICNKVYEFGCNQTDTVATYATNSISVTAVLQRQVPVAPAIVTEVDA